MQFSFQSYNGSSAAPDYLIRLNSDGSVDTSFNGITTGFDDYVYAVKVQTDGKILVGGQFTSYNGSGAIPDGLVRLNSDGSVDSTFSGLTTGFDSSVEAIAIQNDGKILVGGNFTSFNGNSGASDRLLRLNPNGSIDTTFSGVSTGFNNTVFAIRIQNDGKILLGGGFTSLNGNSLAPDYFIKLNMDGTIDSSFTGLTSGFDQQVRDIVVDADSKIIIGGNFQSYNGDPAAPDRIIRLNPDGSMDQSFMGQQH